MKLAENLQIKESKNAVWIIGCRIIQMFISFFVGVWTARYLGPSNYGLINYVSAYISFFTSLCTLGLNSIIVKEYVNHKDEQGEILGTSIVMRIASSILSAVMIVSIISIVDKDEPITILIAVLSSIGLIFQVLDSFQYWFQSRYQSKISSIAMLCGYIIVALYKIFLLVIKAKVYLFALSSSIDYIVIAIFLYIAYKRNKGPKLKFEFKRAIDLLKLSYHFILSGLMVAVYGQTDKLMLKHMLDESQVGYYSTASSLCNMWVFVLAAIIESVFPTIMSLHKLGDEDGFKKKNRQLYCVIFYLSIFVSLFFVFFGGFIINILYGEAYIQSVNPLKIITWYTAFSYLGVARNAWLVCEGKQKYVKYICIFSCIINVVLNYFLIPRFMANGAALASVITELVASIILPLIWKEMRPNVKLVFEAICFKGVFR